MEQPTHDLRPFQTLQANPRRVVSLTAVALIHIVAIYALASGLASSLVQKGLEEIKAEVVKEKPPDLPKTPPPPPPELVKPPPPFVPPPDINLQTEAPATAIQQVTTAITPPAPPKPQAAPPVVAAVLAAGKATRCASSFYPALAVRLNHEGATLVTVHIGADGSVTGADVAESSGHDELDQAAVSCVNRVWNFQPAMQNGHPVASTKQYRIVWKLTG
jgi:protein TonB